MLTIETQILEPKIFAFNLLKRQISYLLTGAGVTRAKCCKVRYIRSYNGVYIRNVYFISTGFHVQSHLRSSLPRCSMTHSQTHNKIQNQTTFINKPFLIPRFRWKGIPVSSWLVDELILRNKRCTLPQLGTSEKKTKFILLRAIHTNTFQLVIRPNCTTIYERGARQTLKKQNR